MILDEGTQSLNAAAARLRVLQQINGDDWQGRCDALLIEYGAIIRNSGRIALNYLGSTTICKGYWAAVENNLYIFVGGAEDSFAAQTIWDGYVDGTFASAVNVTNPVYTNMLDDLLRSGSYAYALLAARIILVGHSAGGAMLLNFLEQLGSDYFHPFTDIVTFGSPKPFGRNRAGLYTTGGVTRFMNIDDAVPYIPPQVTLYERLVSLGVSTWQGARIAAFVQPRGGLQIDLAGRITERVYPNEGSLTRVQHIQRWLSDARLGVENGHSLDVYAARIAAAIALQPTGVPATMRGSPADTTLAPTRPDVGRQIATIQTSFNSTYPSSGVESVVIPPVQQFRAVRSGMVWYVYFGKRIIATAGHKRGARQLARMGNAFLRSLQQRSIVNADTLARQWEEYLAAASDPTSGFEPQLNVV